MLKKIFTVTSIVLALSISSSAVEVEDNIIPLEKVNNCESAYSKCLETCDLSNDENKEPCYDKCDQEYAKCAGETQSNE